MQAQNLDYLLSSPARAMMHARICVPFRPWRRNSMHKKMAIATASSMLFACALVRAQQTSGSSAAAASALKQTETDEYTRYELLAPETASFKISYEVTA